MSGGKRSEEVITGDDDVPLSRFKCTLRQWNNWEWQLKNRIMTVKTFREIFPEADIDGSAIEEVMKKYPFAITPYYASKIKVFDYTDPIFALVVPQTKELEDPPYLADDPLHENDSMPVPFLVHRYKDRCLLMSTSMCSAYCRHCTRKRMAGKKECHISERRLLKIKSYLMEHPEVKDVIISGGDPLSQENSFLETILTTLRSIPHIEIIRFGTRVPVVLPQRITPKLIALLKRYKPIWINTHFNHPQELTREAIEACHRIVDAGIPMGNQSVLLKGINDDPVVMEELCRGLIRYGVRPYYMYQCDLVRGIEHFRTPLSTGIGIMRHLRGRLSGFGIPTFVVDAPGGKGKIPLLPQYYGPKFTSGVHTLWNYQGEMVEYPDPVL